MKKNLFTLWLCFITTFAFSQDDIYLEQVIQTNDSTMSKDKIFDKVHEWFALRFVSANDVIQLNDKENGKMIGKGNFKVSPKNVYGVVSEMGRVDFTLTVLCKDGKYKIVFANLMHDGGASGYNNGGSVKNEKPACGGMKMFKGDWKRIKEETDLDVKSYVEDLQKFVNNTKDKDW